MLNMISERLRIARTRARLTQQQASAAIGVTRSAVAHWEGGDSKPDHGNLISAASAYGVTVEWLLDDSGDVTTFSSGGSTVTEGPCDRSTMRLVASVLYQTLEMDGLTMEPADFGALLLILHDWAQDEGKSGRVPDMERIRWFVRVARAYRRP